MVVIGKAFGGTTQRLGEENNPYIKCEKCGKMHLKWEECKCEKSSK